MSLADFIPGYRAALNETERLRGQVSELTKRCATAEAKADRAVDDYRKMIDALNRKANGHRVFTENPTPTMTANAALELAPTARAKAAEGRRRFNENIAKAMSEVQESA